MYLIVNSESTSQEQLMENPDPKRVVYNTFNRERSVVVTCIGRLQYYINLQTNAIVRNKFLKKKLATFVFTMYTQIPRPTRGISALKKLLESFCYWYKCLAKKTLATDFYVKHLGLIKQNMK